MSLPETLAQISEQTGLRSFYSGVHNMWPWMGNNRPKSRSHRGSLKVRSFFPLYINDLLENIHLEIRLLFIFADGTAVCLYLTINSKSDCQTLQQDHHKLET